MAEKIGPIFNRILIKKLDQALENGSITKKDYDDLKKKYFGKPKLIQMDLFDPEDKKKGGLMEATRRLKAQGLRKGGVPKTKAERRRLGPRGKNNPRGETKSNKTLTPQERKELLDKIKKSQGKMTNPFLKFNKLGQPYMEAKKGGSAKKFPDLSGDGKVTMKDVLMGRGVIKKPKKKQRGGSMDARSAYLKRRAGLSAISSTFKKAKDRKPSGRLTVDDFKSAAKKVGKGLGKTALGPVSALTKASRLAGRLAKRGYGIAKK